MSIHRRKRFSKEEKFSQISTLEGYLQKLSPQFLVGYQKRYFCVRDGGHKLIYYKTKPEIKDKPKGMLEIKDISNIQKKNKTDFVFQYEERKFELRANDEAECDKWIFSLDFLNGFLTTLESQKNKQQLEVRFSSPQNEKKKEKWRINNIDSQTFNEIQAEHERTLLNQKKNHKEPNPITNTLDDFNRILDIKGIKPFIEKLDPNIVKSRLCMGFLSKKGKNNITRYQRRFFILISARSLNKINDGVTLSEDNLPPWLELETIYYFSCKSNDDSSPFIGKISLRNCLSITVEDNQHKNVLENLKQDFIDFGSNLSIMKGLFSWETNLGLLKPEHGFGFKVTTKERTYYFYADLITEMNKWIIAIEQSLKNYKDLHPNFNQEELTINDASPSRKLKIKHSSGEFKDPIEFIPTLNLEKTEIPTTDTSPPLKPNILAKEGYVFKKSINKLRKLIGWKQRYLVLRQENFFWVENNTQKNDPKKTFHVKKIEKCEPHKENQFIMELDQKKYKFKAETLEDRDKWIQLINKARDSIEKNEKIDLNMTVSSESDKSDNKQHYAINGEPGSLEILKVNNTRQDVEEDSIFAKFYVLTDENASMDSLKKKSLDKNSSKDSMAPQKNCSCFRKLFCCFFKTSHHTEEDYYSQF